LNIMCYVRLLLPYRSNTGASDHSNRPYPDDNRHLQMINLVQTRAGRKKAQQLEKDDQTATTESKAIFTAWDDIAVDTLPTEEDSFHRQTKNTRRHQRSYSTERNSRAHEHRT